MGQTGRDQELHRWLEEKRPGWVRLANQVMRNRHEAEDVVQDTLTSLWRKLSRDKVKNRDAYAARAVWLNALKRAKRTRHHASIDDHEPVAPEAETSEEVDPSFLEEALAGLPEAQRTVVRMKFYGGLTFKEIGDTLAISINTAGSRCRYALEALRETLGPTRREP